MRSRRSRIRDFYKQAGGAQGRRGACKECYPAAERAAWERDPRVQARRREIVEWWREEGLGGQVPAGGAGRFALIGSGDNRLHIGEGTRTNAANKGLQ